MGKKKNKKFKQKKQHLSQPAVVNQPVSISAPEREISVPEPVAKSASLTTEAPVEAEEDILNTKYRYVKKDVFKLSIVLSSLAILFIAFYFVSRYTNLLATFGNWIYRIGNFQI